MQTIIYSSGPQPFWHRDQFRGRQFFRRQWSGGMVQAVMRAMGSDGEQEMKLRSLTGCSPPAMCPGS